ncbi:MAG: septal ring lytic transglycosylase RlpA family protein [Treponema sp.]|nr:septal ring lytic transglycosylase RlpA family protein [Treponema sp.]
MKNKFYLIAALVFTGTIFFLSAENSKNTKSSVYKNNVIASYYADAFHGKMTSNGEYFDMNDYTCAHKELPFGTILKVTNLKNGLTVNVRVNDRGPFVAGREIDLSCAAAKALKMTGDGTAKVKLEIVKKVEHTKQSLVTAEKAKEKMAKIEGQNTKKAEKLWDIQLGAYSSRENANKLAQAILREGFTNVVFQKSEGIFRVVIRQVPDSQLAAMTKKLKEKGYKDFTVRERKII